MSLEELLNIRLKSLYEKYKNIERIIESNNNTLKESKDDYELIYLFLEDVKKVEDIRNFDTSFITELLIKYRYISDLNIEDELNVIKLLLKGIHDNKLKISLSREQQSKIEEYYNNAIKLRDELNEKLKKLEGDIKPIQDEFDSLEDNILRIELLIEKIVDKEDLSFLDFDDLDVIKQITEDKSVDPKIKKELLIRFIEYNEDRKNGKSKNNKVDIDEVIACFDEFNINMSRTIKKYEDEVQTYANIKNIKDILTFMKSEDIISKFNMEDLLAICIHGNVESVRDTYDRIRKDKDADFYYNIPSAWIDNIEGRKIKRKKYNGKEIKDSAKSSLNKIAHLISIDEIDKNIKYLTNEGFVFNLNDLGMTKVLTTSNYRLREAVESLKQYGIINKSSVASFKKIWLLAESQILEKLDRFIEIGLLAGHNAPKEYVNYLKNYLGQLHNFEYPEYLILYKVKQSLPNDSYYDSIASTKTGQLSGKINDGLFGVKLNNPQLITEYKDNNFVDFEKEINNYSKYEELIDNNYNVKIDNNILNLSEIQYLEENYRISENPYVYVFDGLVISRFKVLRNYSLIKDGTEESLLASICKGSFLTRESFDKITKCINYKKGGDNGLLKKL